MRQIYVYLNGTDMAIERKSSKCAIAITVLSLENKKKLFRSNCVLFD